MIMRPIMCAGELSAVDYTYSLSLRPRFTDRDIFMLHRGGGVGHLNRPFRKEAYRVSSNIFLHNRYQPSDLGDASISFPDLEIALPVREEPEEDQEITDEILEEEFPPAYDEDEDGLDPDGSNGEGVGSFVGL